MHAKHMVSGGMHLRIVAHHFPGWRHLEWPWLPGSTIAAKPLETFLNVSPSNTTSAIPFWNQLVELVIPDDS